MTRPPRQADIARAIKAAQSAGMVILRVEVLPDGRIVIHTSTWGATTAPDDLRL
jgi:hypothetical protein